MTANSMQWKQYLQDFSAMYSWFFVRIFGLWPYTLDRRTKTFKTTWWMFAPILTGAFCCISLVVILPFLIPSLMKTKWNSDAANMVMSLYGMLIIVCMFTTYSTVYRQTEIIKSIIVRTYEFLEKSQRILPGNTMRTSAILLYLFKTIVLLACFTIVPCLKLRITSLSVAGFLSPFVMIPILINATIPNLFFGYILFATVYYERINVKIEEIVRLANTSAMQSHDRFGRMRRYCELSDSLDELAVLHMELTLITQDVCNTCNVRMTSYITWLSVNAIVQKMFVYGCITLGLMKLIVIPTNLLVIGILSITYIWIDLIMLAHLGFTVMCEVL